MQRPRQSALAYQGGLKIAQTEQSSIKEPDQAKHAHGHRTRDWGKAPVAVLAAAVVLLNPGQFNNGGPSTAFTVNEAIAASLPPRGTAEAAPLPTTFPSLPDVVLPEYKKVVLPNGLRLFLLEDHELGLVRGQLLVQGGTSLVPAEKLGLATMTASVQRSGGSKAHPDGVLDQKLEGLGASIEVATGTTAMQANFRCLAEDLQEVFSLFAEVVQEPAFPQDKLELTRSQLLEALARRNDEPDDVASRELPKLIYGPSSIYARSADPPTVKAVTQADLQDFHRANFRPEKTVLGIWGDFDSTAMQAVVEQVLGNWQPPASAISSTPPEDAPLPSAAGASNVPIHLVDKPGLTQGYVRLGEVGVSINHPDVVPLDVLNNVLNGFGGRLFNQVRSKEGLAYSVFGGWSPALNHQGVFSGGGETQIRTLGAFIRSVRSVLENARQQPPTPDELAKAKDAALNSFVFNFADSGGQLVRIMTFDLFGVDQNFLFRYKSGVEAVTGEEVMQAAQRHLHPQAQQIVVVTDAKEAKAQLQGLGAEVLPLEVS